MSYDPNKVAVSSNGVDIDIFSTLADVKSPWYKINEDLSTDGYTVIEAVTKGGSAVTFSLYKDSPSLKELLSCDPLGENKLTIAIKDELCVTI